jgi:hypothetical protein
VFVFGNGEHLLFGQAAEGDAILQRNHVRARLLITSYWQMPCIVAAA